MQQHLPFTVLKLEIKTKCFDIITLLQQLLPFTVLKLRNIYRSADTVFENVATVSTVHGIETL